MSTLVRKLMLPPPYAEDLTREQWRQGTTMRAIGLAIAIVIDLALVLGLSGHDGIDATALATFGTVNIGLLSLDLIYSMASFRVDALRRRGVLAAVVIAEAFTVIVWVQCTGSLSSYFVLFGAALLILYRLYFGFAIGAVMACAFLVFHGGALVLEHVGVLKAESLFVGPPSTLYAIDAYRQLAFGSVASVYVAVFVVSNLVANRLREKDLALAELRIEADRVAKDARHGRLTGKTLVARYAIGELLGRGGMGEVYVAHDADHDGKLIAIKALHAHLVTELSVLERFRREAEFAAKLPGRHAPEVFDVGYDRAEDIHYIAMEHLRGEDLGALLRRTGPMAFEQVWMFADRVAEAVDAAHVAGIVHRDLKPQNIFLVAEPSGSVAIKLLDFGTSKMLAPGATALTDHHAVIGTLGYMAPEQIAGNSGDVDPRTDTFAFAAILYRALTGRLPFQAADLAAAVHEVLHVNPPAPSKLRTDLHTDVDAVLAIGLAKRPAERYSTTTELVADLRAAAAGQLPTAPKARAGSLNSEFVEGATMQGTN